MKNLPGGIMPHIIVKWYPGRSVARKEELARAITREVAAIGECSESAISVAIEEIAPEAWAETVYRPDILEKEDILIRKPGYDPFAKADK
jgi:4-oxalocrotonate tautomerase